MLVTDIRYQEGLKEWLEQLPGKDYWMTEWDSLIQYINGRIPKGAVSLLRQKLNLDEKDRELIWNLIHDENGILLSNLVNINDLKKIIEHNDCSVAKLINMKLARWDISEGRLKALPILFNPAVQLLLELVKNK